jgi:hypothetical protein
LAQPSVVLAFNTPVYKRHDLTRACMKQRLACIEALPFRAVNIMVGDEPEHEAIAAETGSIFVHHGNNEPALGAKFNAGYAAAREAGATHVMAIGSDSWIAPQALADLPYCTDWVTSLTALSAFKEDGTERFDLSIRYAAGFGVAMIYPIGALGPEPCDPAKPKGCDGSTWRRALIGKGNVNFIRPEKCSYVNFASPDVQVTPYSALKVHRRTSLLESRPEHVFGDLRPLYGDDLVDMIEGLYAARALGRFLHGETPAEAAQRAQAERMQRVAARTGNPTYRHRVNPSARFGGQGAR